MFLISSVTFNYRKGILIMCTPVRCVADITIFIHTCRPFRKVYLHVPCTCKVTARNKKVYLIHISVRIAYIVYLHCLRRLLLQIVTCITVCLQEDNTFPSSKNMYIHITENNYMKLCTVCMNYVASPSACIRIALHS